MTTAGTMSKVDAFWASWLGCDPDALSAPGVRVAQCAARPAQGQLFLFRRGPGCVVSVGQPAGRGGLLEEAESISVRVRAGS